MVLVEASAKPFPDEESLLQSSVQFTDKTREISHVYGFPWMKPGVLGAGKVIVQRESICQSPLQ